ncbi:MAG: DUF4446 family protein [Firmicutes bacterium]|nr:DUF4446 family protein [Bacillota bacterium]
MTLRLPFSGPTFLALALALFALALASLVVALVALRRTRLTETAPATPDSAVAELSRRLQILERDQGNALQRVGLVRYDAFPGAGGQFSFSVALLDGTATGVILTAISGREETRMYAKWVERGASRQPLSPEEGEALARAQAAIRQRREG